MNKLLIATTNPGKFNELKTFLSDLPITLLSLSDLRISQLAPENGVTFEENAVSKARFYADLSHLPTLADDGGFEIDALGGEPGVKSHRWIHRDREDTDEELIAYTMEKMKGIPPDKRGAQLRLVLAFVLLSDTSAGKQGMVHTVEEASRGVIADTPLQQVTPGFPFRALLYFPEIGKYYQSDFTGEELEKYNHRRRAVLRLKPIIKEALC